MAMDVLLNDVHWQKDVGTRTITSDLWLEAVQDDAAYVRQWLTGSLEGENTHKVINVIRMEYRPKR